MAGEGGLGDNAREGELMTGREGREKKGKKLVYSMCTEYRKLSKKTSGWLYTYAKEAARQQIHGSGKREGEFSPRAPTYHSQSSVLELAELHLLQALLVLGEVEGVELEVTGLCRSGREGRVSGCGRCGDLSE